MNVNEAVLYRPEQDIAGHRPLFALKDEAMRQYFMSCEGGLPEAPLINWTWDSLWPTGRGVFIDVGAHVGTWTLPLCWWGSVWAIEPNPEIGSLLSMARTFHPYASNVSLYDMAVSNWSGDTQLFVPSVDGGGGSIVEEYPTYLGTKVHEVHVNTLDNLFPRAPWVDLIKIDVEGAERDVLQGGEQLIKRCQPKILFECWDNNEREDTFRYIVDTLGYRITPVNWWTGEMFIAEPA